MLNLVVVFSCFIFLLDKCIERLLVLFTILFVSSVCFRNFQCWRQYDSMRILLVETIWVSFCSILWNPQIGCLSHQLFSIGFSFPIHLLQYGLLCFLQYCQCYLSIQFLFLLSFFSSCFGIDHLGEKALVFYKFRLWKPILYLEKIHSNIMMSVTMAMMFRYLSEIPDENIFINFNLGWEPGLFGIFSILILLILVVVATTSVRVDTAVVSDVVTNVYEVWVIGYLLGVVLFLSGYP